MRSASKENPISSAFPIRDAIIRCIDRRKRAYAQVRAWAADEARREQQSQSPGRKDDDQSGVVKIEGA